MTKSSKKHYKSKKNTTRKKKHINDYYLHVNNSWIAQNKLTSLDSASQKNIFVSLKRKVTHQLLDVLKNHVIKGTSPNEKRCNALFSSMTHWNDELVSKHFYLFLKEINDYRKNSDEKNLHRFLAWSIKNGVITPIDFGIINDIKKPDRYIAAISENGFGFNNKEAYFGKEKELRNAYKKLIHEAFVLFFGESNCYSAEDAFDVEMKLAKYMYSLEENASPIKTYNKMTPKNVEKHCKLDCVFLLKEINMENVKHINIINPKYVKHAMTLMKKDWTGQTWNSYWTFKLLVYFSRFHSKLHQHFSSFLMSVNGETKPETVEEIAMKRICEIMHSTMSKKYVELYKNPKEIKFATGLTQKLIHAFHKRLLENNWMETNTKKMALLKLEKMITAIGYRHKYPEDPDCDFVENDDFGNNLKYLVWLLQKFRREVNRKIIDNQYWLKTEEMNVYDVNAYYNNVENEIILPNALLQKPFVDLEKGFVYNLARIGFATAHEMIHAFDVNGSLFDEKGGLNYWWSSRDVEKYKDIQDNVIEQYETLASKDGVQIDGQMTLSENIADISGLAIIEDVLKNELDKKGVNDDEEQKTYFKELYRNFASQWRTVETSSKEKFLIEFDPHSLSKYRVNCVLMRSNMFKYVYGIQENDKMYHEKYFSQIW